MFEYPMICLSPIGKFDYLEEKSLVNGLTMVNRYIKDSVNVREKTLVICR